MFLVDCCYTVSVHLFVLPVFSVLGRLKSVILVVLVFILNYFVCHAHSQFNLHNPV